MCGFFAKQFRFAEEEALLAALKIKTLLPEGQWYQRGVVSGLITAVGGGHAVTEALWWYALRKDGERWIANEDITSFNARNLDNRLWRDAVRTRRGFVVASEIGEAEGRDRYLMKSERPLLIGALYKDWDSSPGNPGVRSMALITRPPHPRFSRYHSKSIPCFLPLDTAFLNSWLDPHVPGSEAIDALLNQPKIFSDLHVQKVKTYKRAEPLDEPERLQADES